MEIFSQFEVWTFFTGLGIFLFGMHVMEESIRVLSRAVFKLIIRKLTVKQLKANFSEMIRTAILQNSCQSGFIKK